MLARCNDGYNVETVYEYGFFFQSMDPENAEHDVYDELLTQAEIQGNINKVNSKSYHT